ncbi:MAG: hypothetical protein GEU79_02470 [Acidimicrobiia bacterium]|nr:hypothetical protein [Acidimicrobiia bacterium]
MNQPTVTLGTRRGRHTTHRYDPAASLRSALASVKPARRDAKRSHRSFAGVTAMGFGDRPGHWSEDRDPSSPARPDRRPVLLPETFQEALQAASMGQALPTKKLRMPLSRVGADMTSQLWATSDISEMVTATAPVQSARMERLSSWLSPTITTLLVIGVGVALRIAAG